jgi:hypothetical protein
LRCRDIIGFKPLKVLLLPIWAIAAIFSEFCIAKVLRIPGSLLMPLHRTLVGRITKVQAEELPSWTWVIFLMLGVLLFLDDWSRRVFLGWIFTTNEPLASRLGSLIDPEDVEVVARSKVPVYATLSRYQPGAGWFPQYVRLDQLRREKVIDTLVQSAGFPGIFPSPGYFGRHVVDGGWTDNIPLAPMLFDPACSLDLIFVIKVDRTARTPSRLKRVLAAAGAKLWGKVSARPATDQDNLVEWARARWEAFLTHDPARASRSDHPDGPEKADAPKTLVHTPKIPCVVTLVPQHPLGNVLTGTLWFSRAKARRLIEQGEKDMAAALAGFAQRPVSGVRCGSAWASEAAAETPLESPTSALA